MLVAERDQRLVQRVPASLSLGHRPLAALARAQAALLPSHGETASAVFDVRNGGASAGPRCCTTRRVGALPQAAGCMCLLLSPRTACVMLTRPPEPVLKPSSVDFARRGRHPPPFGAGASYSQLERAARDRALMTPCRLPCATSGLYMVHPPL
jgi:hypothetical protein